MSVDPFLIAFERLINNHPHFYSGEQTYYPREIVFSVYKKQHPLNTPTNAARATPKNVYGIEWVDEHQHYRFAPDIFSTDPKTLSQNSGEIRTKLHGMLDELSTHYDKKQFRAFTHSSIPDSTHQKLYEQFDTHYNALKASAEELKQVDGMGDARTKQFLDPDNTPRNKPQWAALTHCPNCSEEFWSTIDRSVHPDENKPRIDTIQHRTYCPNCDHAEIPRSHISEPVEFTDDNILTD